MQPIVFVDLDGVLVDLQRGFAELNKKPYKKMSHKEFSNIIQKYLKNLSVKQIVNFWSNLPETKDCQKLWENLSQFQPIILSACGNCEASCLGKKLWCKKHLGLDKDRVFCSKNSAEKQLYASPKSILIDDYEKNIEQFNNKGGYGIHHTRTNKTLETLKKHLNLLGITQKL